MMLEKDILKTAQEAIKGSLIENLTKYHGPLQKLCEQVIEDNKGSLYELINTEFSTLLNSDDFQNSLKCALNTKLAKVLVSKMGGELEKRVNQLKANPVTRAKITLAIEKCLKEV